MAQAVIHRSLHHRGHAFPVQPKVARRSLLTQLARQPCHCVGQRHGDARPWFGPGEFLHPNPASRTLHASRSVAPFQGQRPHRHIAPFPLRPHPMHLTAPVTAHATTQQTMAETIDVNHHRVLVLHHFSRRMGFQSELLSDKRLDEHLESDPFIVGPEEHNNEIGKRCSFHHCPPATSCIYGASPPITVLGHEPTIRASKVGGAKLVVVFSKSTNRSTRCRQLNT